MFTARFDKVKYLRKMALAGYGEYSLYLESLFGDERELHNEARDILRKLSPEEESRVLSLKQPIDEIIQSFSSITEEEKNVLIRSEEQLERWLELEYFKYKYNTKYIDIELYKKEFESGS